MFRGINPDGLINLAEAVEHHSDVAEARSKVAFDLLSRNGMSAEAKRIDSAFAHIQLWGRDTSDGLRWRANAIRIGQDVELTSFDPIRTQFAAEAIFALHNIGAAYDLWVEKHLASKQRVADAVARISEWLHQGWTDWDVTNDDLQGIWATLQTLSRDELDDVISALTPAQLERWVEEIGNRINGFSKEEKQRLFALLATNSSGNSLGKVHEAITTAASGEDAMDFGNAIRLHSTDQVISDFISCVVAGEMTRRAFSGVAPALALAGIDDTAVIDQVVRLIVTTEGTLELMIADRLVLSGASGNVAAGSLDPVANAVERGSDPETKALAFAAIATLAAASDRHLIEMVRARDRMAAATPPDHMRPGHEEHREAKMLSAVRLELLGAASAVLISDSDGVIRHLATDLDPQGTVTTAYLYQLVDVGLIKELGQLVDALRGDGSVDPIAFSVRDTHPNYPYPFAQNLGFVAGSMHTALVRYAKDAKNDIDWITTAAKVASGAIGFAYSKALAAMEAAGLLVEGSLEWLSTDHWATKTQDEIDRSLERLLEVVAASLQPPLSPGNGPPHLGDALQWWSLRFETVQTGGQP